MPGEEFKLTGLRDVLLDGSGWTLSDMPELVLEDSGIDELLLREVMLPPIEGLELVPPHPLLLLVGLGSLVRPASEEPVPLGELTLPPLVKAVLSTVLSLPPRLVKPNPLSAPPFIYD
jgi:hypothetical protein